MDRHTGSLLWLAATIGAVCVLPSTPLAQPTPGLRATVGQGNISTDCKFTYGQYSWDLSGLIQPYGNGYLSGPDGSGYYYWLNVCGNVACTAGAGQEAGVCQSKFGNTLPGHVVGYYGGYAPNNILPYWDLISASNPGAGLMFVLPNGDSCTNPRRANIYFDCNPAATSYTQNFTISSAGLSCVYDIHFATNRSCIPGYVPPTVVSSSAPLSSTGGAAAQSSTGGGRGRASSSTAGWRPPNVTSSTGPFVPNNSTGGEPLLDLSAGSWFLVSFAALTFAYVLFGCICRRVTYGVVGCDACPHYPFWSRLPGYVAEGFRFTWYKIRCRTVPRVAYDAMK